ncbi:MAG: hypothetical protein J5824_05090 [Lachnospiraceae bacterium]|nr:hypothetical protein [Lachnospiraceae bacterium]
MKRFITNNAKSFLALLAAVILVIIGILTGQYSQVLSKAIRVCLECIGIG